VNEIEHQLLAWADAGWINYRSSGHDLFVELPPPPQNASERVATLIERYETIATQRVQEMVAYATTSRCRHGHINAYLGGRTIEQCGACDNCADLPSLPPLDLPDQREQLLTILKCISNARWGGWGRRTLVNILRGNSGTRSSGRRLRAEACSQAEFGALAFRSATSIGHLIDVLLHERFLQERRLENGGTVIELGTAGQAALSDHKKLDSLLSPTPSDRAPDRSGQESQPAHQRAGENRGDLKVDETLFEALRAWRRAQAQDEKVPPYVILHDRALRTIAAQYPTTLENLSKVKGIGKVKLAKYGTQVIEIISAHLRAGSLEGG
jgi:ATP-dependent DNA helicase RecQ